jgi:hypothetical protein
LLNYIIRIKHTIMSLFKRIGKAIKEELTKPSSFVKGEVFEDYVRNIVFPSDCYKLINRTHNYATNNGDYVESSLKPDFEFQCLETSKKFHVEVKYRKGYYNYQDKLEWCKPYQLKRYKEIDKEQPVFLLLGIGDRPNKPDEIFIIPMSKIGFTGFYDSFLDQYSFPYVDKPVFQKYLWKL